MSQENLIQAFKVADVEQSELEQLLLDHFGRAGGINPSEIQYRREDTGEPALTLRYDQDGELVSIDRECGLLASDESEIADKIERLLLNSTGIAIGQTVLFARVPTTGHFTYRGRFQLLPVPQEAPRPPFILGQQPLILQYTFSQSEDMLINFLRRARVAREIELLCVALTSSIWLSHGPVTNHHWVFNTDNPENWKSEFRQEGYTYPGANAFLPSFSDVSGTPKLARIPTATYYTRSGIGPDQALDLPEDFEELLDRYFRCPRENQDRFLRSAYWFQYAQRVANISRSGSFTALVSAIEALMPPPGPPEKTCPQCTRPFGQGPTQRFINFVDQYAPGPTASAKDHRKLYALRSALSHGGSLLPSDRHGWMTGLTPKSVDQWADERSIWQVVRASLVNWLAVH